MLIDWFTVIAQAINFLILAWLLKRLLFKPVLNAIDERQAKIDQQLRDAAQAKETAEWERAALKERTEELDRRKSEIVASARADAAAEKARLIDAARGEANALEARLRRDVEEQQASAQEEIARGIQRRAFAIADRVLRDLASSSLEQRVAEAFTRQLDRLTPEEKRSLNGGHIVRLRSAMDLDQGSRELIASALSRSIGPAEIRFERDPNLINGIEMVSGGRKLEWNVADSLDNLAERVGGVGT